MQTCYNCGKEVSDQTLICPECGALVKRYTTPPPRQNQEQNSQANPQPGWQQPQEPYGQQPNQQKPYSQQSWQQPQYQQPFQNPARPTRLQFRGWPKVWLILCTIFSVYMGVVFGYAVYMVRNPQIFTDITAEMPEMAGYVDMLMEYLAILTEALPLCIVFAIYYALKTFCHIWLLSSCRKLAFWVSAGISSAGFLIMMVLGGGIGSVLYCLDCPITIISIRRYWPFMKK